MIKNEHARSHEPDNCEHATTTVRQVLNRMGAYAAPPRGRPPLYNRREHRDVNRQKAEVALEARLRAERDALEAGLERPEWRRGRARVHTNKDTMSASKRIRRQRMSKRLQSALVLLVASRDILQTDSATSRNDSIS